jgi:digeranylgeranylglycerophospholipid reductase
LSREEIAVVGGGPAGLLTALNIDNHDVVVYEEHKDVGVPKHCAGFVSNETARILTRYASKDVIDHKYWNIVFYTPKGVYRLYFKDPIVYHVNRPLLEKKLLDRVVGKGHKIFFKKKARPGSKPGEVIVKGDSLSYDLVVASDGASSLFRSKYLGRISKRLVGVQYIYRIKGLDPDTIHYGYCNYRKRTCFFGNYC